MKKKFMVLGATLLSAVVAGLCPVIADAKTEKTNDSPFVFNANNVNQSKTYNSGNAVSSANGVTVKMGSFKGTVKSASAVYDDYSFSNAVYTENGSSNNCYDITASKGTTIGIYYSANNSSSSNVKLEVTRDYKILWIFRIYTEVLETYTSKPGNLCYAEYTFNDQTNVGLRAANQNFWLYGLTVVSNEELTNRSEANTAIDNLIAYYNNNGANLSNEFVALVNKAQAEVNEVNNISQVSNYAKFEEIVSEYNELVSDNEKANDVVTLISNLGDVEYTQEYKNQLDAVKNQLANVKNVEFVSNYDLYNEKLNAFNALSNEAVNAFVNKVEEANAVIGETSSYVLINEAETLYNELIESDAKSNAVVNALNTLNEVKNSYAEMEEAVTDNSFAFSYNEDGSVYKILFIGTINDFTSTSDLKKLVIYYTNESTGAETAVDLHSVYAGLKVSGKIVKEDKTGVRYIYTKIFNDDNQYSGVTFSMRYEVVYKDGHVIKSASTTVEVM